VAIIDTNGVRRHAAMGRRAELAEQVQRAEGLDVHSPDLEDVIGADRDAFTLGFAAPMVDDRSGCHMVTSLDIGAG
jgi:hypothetical protein